MSLFSLPRLLRELDSHGPDRNEHVTRKGDFLKSRDSTVVVNGTDV